MNYSFCCQSILLVNPNCSADTDNCGVPFTSKSGKFRIECVQADAEMYSRQAAQLTEAFHDAFWNASAGVYSTGTQMAQAAALWVGAVPSTELPKHVANLAEDVVQNGVTFGFLGVQYVFEALAKNGRVDAALECLLRTSDG